ncbi:hypothetical protein KsCSTR_26530 [Candidatus Kuenenia stuttgartiensis]|uniref:Uncharacterized protein n=1 Tax=Kuenenia stuttgartiensis TaxID=174633 RepID=Q1Q7A5_KUEST|nr:hypothetical protein KsCSTR_26530 [Candidatus Kuenenia stuttgartiensis]CAJ73458.1 unknown protein [Candidatus Kuenenia stuttgartiensis]
MIHVICYFNNNNLHNKDINYTKIALIRRPVFLFFIGATNRENIAFLSKILNRLVYLLLPPICPFFV